MSRNSSEFEIKNLEARLKSVQEAREDLIKHLVKDNLKYDHLQIVTIKRIH